MFVQKMFLKYIESKAGIDTQRERERERDGEGDS
jgi:hypothetical protein